MKYIFALILGLLLAGCAVDTDTEPVGTTGTAISGGSYGSWDYWHMNVLDDRSSVIFASYPVPQQTIHVLNVDSDGDLMWRVVDEDGSTLTGYNRSEVPGQSASTTIRSETVPSTSEYYYDTGAGEFVHYVYSVNTSGYVQYVKYTREDATGTWGSWTSLSSLGSFKSASVVNDPWCTSALLLLVRASDNQPMYALSDDCETWTGPWSMDNVPSGSGGLQMTGADWNGGIQAFVGNTNGKFYVSTYNPDCTTEGAGCWNGWSQIPAISSYGQSKTLLKVTTLRWPSSYSDRQVCLHAYHRPRWNLFVGYGNWGIYERCTDDDTFETWHSLGRMNNLDIAFDMPPVAYNHETMHLGYPQTYGDVYVMDVCEYDYFGNNAQSYSVKTAEGIYTY